MAKQRYISTSFWEDEWIGDLSWEEKYLYLYLLTNPKTNITGIYKITIRTVAFDTGLSRDRIEQIFNTFTSDKKAYYFKEHVILPNWPKHQNYEKRERIKTGIQQQLIGIPPEVLAYAYKNGYCFPPKYLKTQILSCYFDSDSDSDLDINNTIVPEATKTIDACASLVPVTEKKESELYNSIKIMFEQEQPKHRFTDYGKEGKAIKGLIKKCENYSPENTDWIFAMIALFKELRQSDNFYGKQPFTPSALNSAGIFDRVLNEARIRWESNQVSNGDIPF